MFSFSAVSLSLFKMALACKASILNLDISSAESFFVLHDPAFVSSAAFLAYSAPMVAFSV